MCTGLVAIATTLARQRGAAGIFGLVAAVTALTSAAVFAVQMAVDGVALKAAIDAWESATGTTDQAAAYRVADSIRSIEKGSAHGSTSPTGSPCSTSGSGSP
jgi:hypothetical protein